MLKVLLVDDEPLIRRGLREKIDWAALGFEIHAEAKNGLEALELAKTTRPDLILCDMKMPVMDGIGLLEALKKEAVTSKVVVISAYSSFNYTHAAVRHGAFDYILKPVDAEELLDVLSRVKASLNRHALSDMADTLPGSETIHLSREKFLKSFNSSVIIDTTGLKPKILDIDMRLDHKKYISLAKLIADLVRSSASAYGFTAAAFENPLYKDTLFAILGCEEEPADISDILEHIKSQIESFMRNEISIGVGTVCSIFNEINLSFTQALNALNCRNIVSENCIVFAGDIKTEDSKPIIYSPEKEKAFLTSLEICNRDEMKLNIKHLFSYIKSRNDVSFRQVYKLCSELLFLCERILRKYGSSLDDIFGEDIISIDYIACKGSLLHLEEWFIHVMARLSLII